MADSDTVRPQYRCPELLDEAKRQNLRTVRIPQQKIHPKEGNSS